MFLLKQIVTLMGILLTLNTFSSLHADNPPDVNLSVAEWSTGNKKFTSEFYSLAKEPEKNFIFSPLSLQMALSMITELTDGETQKELIKISGLPSDPVNRQKTAKILMGIFNTGDPSKEDSLSLLLANGAWVSSDVVFKKDFSETFTRAYKGILSPADFTYSFRNIKEEINQWVDENTQSKIKNFLPNGALTSDTKLVLVNTLYMRAPWQYPFDPSMTYKNAFKGVDGLIENVSFMQIKKKFNVLRKETCTVIEMPFVKTNVNDENNPTNAAQLSFYIILPRTGIPLHEVESAMNQYQLGDWMKDPKPRLIDLHLPKFKVSSIINAKSVLQNMGLNLPFTANAQFDIENQENLAITDIFHQAVLEIDEKGGVGAAATGVVVGVTSYQEPETIIVDRPFLVIIAEKSSGIILFAGHVNNPNLKN